MGVPQSVSSSAPLLSRSTSFANPKSVIFNTAVSGSCNIHIWLYLLVRKEVSQMRGSRMHTDDDSSRFWGCWRKQGENHTRRTFIASKIPSNHGEWFYGSEGSVDRKLKVRLDDASCEKSGELLPSWRRKLRTRDSASLCSGCSDKNLWKSPPKPDCR